MQNSQLLFCILIFFTLNRCINTTHFEGGTITYKLLNTSGSTISILLIQNYIYDYTKIYCNDSMIANQSPKLDLASYLESSSSVACIQYCNQSGGYTAQPVISYCTDYSVSLGMTIGQRSDRLDLANGSYFVVSFQSASWRQLTLPSNSTSTNTQWSITCLINLQMRADGTFNHPPSSAMISPIYVPVGVQQVITIPTIDSDNDDVRCRFANGSSECGSACPPATLPSGTTLYSNCTLLITGYAVGDWYAIAIQIEDYINSTSRAPLSMVPLQFLINVQAVSSCTTRPLLTSAASQSGKCVAIQVGQPYSIQLVAQNFCPSTTTIKDIATLSFPIVVKNTIVKNTSTLWSVSLTWTPTATSVGSQVLCAVAVDSNNVQSNQYCTTFSVSNDPSALCPGQQAHRHQRLQLLRQQPRLHPPPPLQQLQHRPPQPQRLLLPPPPPQQQLQHRPPRPRRLPLQPQRPPRLQPPPPLQQLPPLLPQLQQLQPLLLPQLQRRPRLGNQTPAPQFPWPLFGSILGVLALLLLTLGICFCCLTCCPKCCLCCPFKRRKGHPAKRGPAANSNLPRRLVDYYIVDSSFGKPSSANGNISDSNRSVSTISNRTIDDVQMNVLSSARSEKRLPHYATPLKRSPRVAPLPSPSISFSSTARIIPSEYVFGGRQSLNTSPRFIN
ncbi:unnamed protein product [Adineta ricciae]|uniref:Uncharacterized protein n=1 Tax=Adineta ricciae TaxID=249248 RepID=A0A814AV62_ADIRI|nr:unnamed protein product [Adineta ricciae]CAF0959507.1 unnamed protein product [Adineta ricciae]